MHRLLYACLSDEYISYLKDPSTALLDDNCFLTVCASREYDHGKPDDRISGAAQLKEMINFVESHGTGNLSNYICYTWVSITLTYASAYLRQ
jgi:hypothetical protein